MVRTLTYRDLTPAQRAKAANGARTKLLGFLENPFLSAEQRQAVFDKIALVGRWEKLQLDPQAKTPTLPAKAPQHHAVVVEDSVGMTEKAS